MKELTDKERLDWLEAEAREPNGLLLHAEYGPTGRKGLGLSRPDRSLRSAIDQAMQWDDHVKLTNEVHAQTDKA